MRVTVDKDRCIGSGQCAWAVPEVFDQDNDGTVQLVRPSPPPSLRGRVRRAEATCPAGAISVQDE